MTVRHGRKHAPERGTRTRCATCHRFARLLPGQSECNRCLGALDLDFGGDR
jgi:hypothetical protein